MRRSASVVLLALVPVFAATFAAQRGGAPDVDQDPFKGVTIDGRVVTGLFPLRATGVSTKPVAAAATAFLLTLSGDQRASTTFAVDDSEWRKWNNVHRATRAGIAFKDMSEQQQARALGLLQASLSAKGLEKTRNVMRLNHTIAELTNNFTEYGEGLYFLVVFGEPSATEPWGWQLEGHHLIINYFVLGDQVVMTPTFMGSEPVIATSGKYAGTKVLQDEQDEGLAFMRALTREQQQKAMIETGPKTSNKAQSQAFRDNLVLPYEGIKGADLTTAQKTQLLKVIGEYVRNMDDAHATVRMEEVRTHIDDTYFAWIGGFDPDGIFYYRIHSPVILIEFDHQTPVALRGTSAPSRQHVHTVVRTPNGNDYGKDLLRQHYERHAHDPAHGHTTLKAIDPSFDR
jgi:hypothetical protein